MTYLGQSGIVDKGAIIPPKNALCLLCLESKRKETAEPLKIHETGSSFSIPQFCNLAKMISEFQDYAWWDKFLCYLIIRSFIVTRQAFLEHPVWGIEKLLQLYKRGDETNHGLGQPRFSKWDLGFHLLSIWIASVFAAMPLQLGSTRARSILLLNLSVPGRACASPDHKLIEGY